MRPQSGFRTRLRSCGIAFSILLFPTQGWSQAACPTCEPRLALSAEEWACLGRSVDRYLATKADPVLVPFVQCNQPNVSAEDQTRADPSIVPRSSPEGALNYRRAIRLSKFQLRCIKAKIQELMSASPPVFDFDKNCSPENSSATQR